MQTSAQLIAQQLRAVKTELPQELRAQVLLTLDYALAAPEIWPQLQEILPAMTAHMERMGRWVEWIAYLERGVAAARRAGDRAGQARLMSAVGRLYRLHGNYEVAAQWLQSAIDLAREIDQPEIAAQALNQLGYVARLQRRFLETEAHVKAALELLGPEDVERASSFWVLGMLATDRGELSAALSYHQQATEIWTRADDRQRLSWSLHNLASVQMALGNSEQAAATLQQVIRVLGDLGDRRNQAVARMSLGIMHIYQERPHDALALFSLAESAFRTAGDRLHLAMVYNNLAVARRMLQMWEPAIQAAETSMRQWEWLDNPASLANTLGELGLAYLGAGRVADARIVFRRALAIIETLPPGSTRDGLQAEAEANLLLVES